MQILANLSTRGDEAQLMEAIQKAQLVVAVRMRDFAEVRRFVECEGMDANARDYVS